MTTLAADLYLLVAAYGLAVAVSYAGLPVLGQGAFVAVGAFGTTQLAMHGVPLGVAVGIAVAGAGLCGYAVGYAGARLAGGPLALATWTLAWLVYTALQLFPSLGGGAQGLTRPTPARLVSPSLGVTVTLSPAVHVAVAAATCVLLALVLRAVPATAWGLDLAALRTGPVLAESLGVPVQRRRRAVLATAAALGAFAGAGTTVLQGVVAAVDYSPLLSLQLFVAVLVGGTATWWGPAVGVALLAALPSVADPLASPLGIETVRARGVVTAVLLVAALATRGPVARWLERQGPPGARRPAAEPATATAALSPAVAPAVAPGTPLLELRAVSASYGAVRVLDGVDLDVRAGEVHALVGPNGSGKSTALRVAAGVVVPTAGHVAIANAPAPASPSARVRRGVARTLQRTSMLGNLDAGTQVAVGARAADRMSQLGLREMVRSPRSRAATTARSAAVASSLDLVGLYDRRHLPTSQLDSAEQRLLQIARSAATGAAVLLLDEPAAGMSAPQRARLETVVRDITRSGRGVLLVEHDMGLVRRVADRVTVLAEGRVLATGTPAEISADPEVARAYLGSP